MAQPIVRHFRSTTAGKLPAAAAISVGQIGVNYNSSDPFLCIKDSDNNVRRLGGATTSAVPPTTPTNGQLWVDTSSPAAPVLKIWDGTTWARVTYGLKSGAVAPSIPAVGDLWADTSGVNPVLKVYNGTDWVSVDTQPPTATTAVTGVSRLATSADLSAGATDRVVTASLLKSNLPVPATETIVGIVELATSAETATGTDTTRAVHPAGLKAQLDLKAPLSSPTFTGTPSAPTATPGTNTAQIATTAFVAAAIQGGITLPVASETVAGIVELADISETLSGSDNTRAVHPLGLSNAISGKANSADVYTRSELYTKSEADALYLPRNITSLPPLP